MHIRENPRNVRSVAQLAREFGCSPSHFSRSFKAVTGHPPELYMVQARLHRAQRLLRETDWPVGEIAGTCGYANIFSSPGNSRNLSANPRRNTGTLSHPQRDGRARKSKAA